MVLIRWMRLLCMPLAFLMLVGGLAWSTVGIAHAAPRSDNTQTLIHKVIDGVSTQSVLTYKYNNAHTGQDLNETYLTTSTVNATSFGERVSYPVDGQIYAQPLYVSHLLINSVSSNVVFVATEHDSVYAFNADTTNANQGLLWHTSFLINGARVPTNNDVMCNDTRPEIGITSTPVIDPLTQTLYVVAFTREGGKLTYRLHALDITTGQEKAGSPIRIQASGFNPLRERQRAALVLANNRIYIAWASFCDNKTYHGWIMSYSYDGTAFQRVDTYNNTPHGVQGGIWGSGAGLAASDNGDIYYVSGNGSFDLNRGGHNAGDSFVHLSASLDMLDYFTPFNQECLSAVDADLGSGGLLMVPGHNEIIGAGKEGRLYVLNALNMGRHVSIANPCAHLHRTNIDRIVQEMAPGAIGGLFSTAVYWNGSEGEMIYLASVGHRTGAYLLQSNGHLSSMPISQTPETFGFMGGNPVVSSNGQLEGTGVLWTLDPKSTLRAYDATNLGTELYNSDQNQARDKMDDYVKFSSPLVANGEVFVPTAQALQIYGRVAATPPPPNDVYNNKGISDDAQPTAANYDGVGFSYSAQALQAAQITPNGTLVYNNVVFTWPNVATGGLDNYQAQGQKITITPVVGATKLAFLGSATNGSQRGTTKLTYTDNTIQTFTLGMTDWVATIPEFGDQVVVTLPYRNGVAGRQNVNVHLFYADVALAPGKTLKSVTLPPANVAGSVLHIFALGTM